MRAAFQNAAQGQQGMVSGIHPRPSAKKPAVRRRGSVQQGFALETLGHAVEYLVDSRMWTTSAEDAQTDQEAVQLLMRLSRMVFSECPEVIPVHRRLGRWMAGQWRSGEESRGCPPA